MRWVSKNGMVSYGSREWGTPKKLYRVPSYRFYGSPLWEALHNSFSSLQLAEHLRTCDPSDLIYLHLVAIATPHLGNQQPADETHRLFFLFAIPWPFFCETFNGRCFAFGKQGTGGRFCCEEWPFVLRRKHENLSQKTLGCLETPTVGRVKTHFIFGSMNHARIPSSCENPEWKLASEGFFFETREPPTSY